MSTVVGIDRQVNRIQEKYDLDADDAQLLTRLLENVVESRDRKINRLKKQVRPREFIWNEADISGALRNCIMAHGPITPQWIGSASKRIYTQCQKVVPKSTLQLNLDLGEEK